MTRRNRILTSVGIIVAVLAILGFIAFRWFQGLTSFPSSAEAGVSFQTVVSERPEGSICLDGEGHSGLAKELIDLQTKAVFLGKGDNVMSDSEWEDFSPRFPVLKNINRNTMFTGSCFYRSPTAPADCQGDACEVTREYANYDWVDLSVVESQDCFANEGATCAGSGVDAGAISVTVTSKCHQVTWIDEIYDLVDAAGNRYVMHATETGTPDLNVELPDGWTLSRVTLDEPLVVNPFGGGDNCYHNVLRDHLGQGYHQYAFVNQNYP